jgi:hypothetical protein
MERKVTEMSVRAFGECAWEKPERVHATAISRAGSLLRDETRAGWAGGNRSPYQCGDWVWRGF